MSEIKFCEDCQWYRWSLLGRDMSRCVRPRAENALSRRAIRERLFCDIERAHKFEHLPNKCGTKAIFFQPKRPSYWRVFWGWVAGSATEKAGRSNVV